MGAILATGTLPVPPRTGRMDFLPLVTVILVLLAVRLALGIRLHWPIVLTVVAVGTVLAGSIEAWGVAIPTAVALAAATILSGAVHRRAQRGHPAP